MRMLGLRRDPVMGDVVRARLDALLRDIDRGAPTSDPALPNEQNAAVVPSEGQLPPQPAEMGAGARFSRRDVDFPPVGAGARGNDGDPAPRRRKPAAESSGGNRWEHAVEFTRRHLAVIATLGLIGLLATVWGITQARAIPVDQPVPVPVVTGSAPPGTTPTPTPAPSIRVHAVGAVATPGVVSLPEGSRVEDAIAAAGGLLPGASPGELNLAQVIADGSQIVVGNSGRPGGEVRGGPGAGGATKPGGAGAPGTAASGAKLDLNRATAEQLDALPGVGPVTASAIVSWRTAKGKFTRIEELEEVDGIGPKTVEKLASLVRV